MHAYHAVRALGRSRGLGAGSTRLLLFFFQAEDGIRDLVRSRGLGDVYKRQVMRVITNPSARASLTFLATGNTATAEPMPARALTLSLIHI